MTMVFGLRSRVHETTTGTSTGDLVLAGAVSGKRTFASVYADGATMQVVTAMGADWETFIGTYNSGANSVSRTKMKESTNSNNAVNWSAGTKDIFVDLIGPSGLDAADLKDVRGTLGIGLGIRNVLHNGGFQVAQRGAGPFTSVSAPVNNDDTYLLDGCIFLANGTDTCDVSQIANTDFVSGKAIRLDVETGNRRFGVLFPIGSANIQAIRKSGLASVQFKVKRTGTTLANVRAYLLAWSSTADAITSDPISGWGTAGNDPTFVANWTAENAGSQLAVGTTIATHKIEGIVVDTASVANLALLIISDPTTTTVTDFLDIGDVQVEEGPVATDYEHRPINLDTMLCQRYYEEVDAGTDGFPLFIQGTTSNNRQCHVTFLVEKRVAPTVVISDLTSTPNTANITTEGFKGTDNAGNTTLEVAFGKYTASAEL